MLHLEEIHFAYTEKKILKGITFSVAEGEIVALIGISGSGKTTLFRLITGLISPTEGKVTVNNENLPEGAIHTTYMRQDDLLLPWRTVLANLLLFSELGKKNVNNRDALKEEALSLLKKVGLEGTEDLFPKELSGGMRQRVALARALLQNRPLMLLDEPFASLDVVIRQQLYALLRSIRDQYKKTIVMVTHDFRDAIALADRILLLAKGKIVGIYSPTNPEQLIEQLHSNLFLSQCT